ncbi:hypothetical protein O181_094494 [Austropuccinia psidii MF-1]|uniref:Reverse transcriptase Ty1/copia-type domain-containing protein n=1 Tax=Austropuccinia psidii MF-1 TaxID=1389203 RepID=A0A9Q3PAV8_9BASI|nr:hypothetical protein [Austropuccinia psidii MF-1]
MGSRHQTLITGDVSEEHILPYRRIAHQTIKKSVPNSYQQAINSKKCKEWEKEIYKELDSMEKLKVWTITEKKPKDHPITCTWVFKIKKDNQKQVIKHKAGLCT